LLIATATNIVVTQISTEGNLETDITNQLLQFPTLLFITARTIFLLELTPINFLLTSNIAAVLAINVFILTKQPAEVLKKNKDIDEEESEKMKTSENVINLLSVDPIEFEFDYALIPLVDANQRGDLLDRIVIIRRQLAIELDVVVPVVRI